MSTARKITVEVPAELLDRALASSGEGVTATVRFGLELVAGKRAATALRAYRGKVHGALDWRALRADDDE